jgi:hypothetical protein
LKDKFQITAYEAIEDPVSIRTAQRARGWIEELPERFAYRCLPLAIANQVGWELLNPVSFTASWNGKDGLDAIKIRFHGEPSPLIGSHFGHGVLTFTPGYLFRTTKSHNLYVKGPANRPKDGIAPLEGLIETDWAPYSFTMNWQFTRKRHKVTFDQQYVDWRDARLKFNEELKVAGSDAAKKGWQRSYMKGEDSAGNTFAGHETKIQMKEFRRG